jgi:hypothetical protein
MASVTDTYMTFLLSARSEKQLKGLFQRLAIEHFCGRFDEKEMLCFCIDVQEIGHVQIHV